MSFITVDATLIFQIFNTLAIILLVVGIAYLIHRLIKRSSGTQKELKVLSNKIDDIQRKLKGE